jgi:hypothetical protein
LAPTFGLKDIPNDWEIELEDEFVKFLDVLNRPWRYNPDGTPKVEILKGGNRQRCIGRQVIILRKVIQTVEKEHRVGEGVMACLTDCGVTTVTMMHIRVDMVM